MTLKRSPGSQPIERIQQRRFRLQRSTCPAIEPDVSMMYVTSRGMRGSRRVRDVRHEHDQRVGLAVLRLDEHGGARCAADVGRPVQLEVAIGWYRAVQRDRVAAVDALVDLHRVISALEFRERESCVELDRRA